MLLLSHVLLPCFNPRTHTGCDVLTNLICFTNNKFQSTHPHGVRLSPHLLENMRRCVSIHAPTRGATYSVFLCMERLLCFNPRTHTGCDLPLVILVLRPQRFQSTHPHGVRHQGVCLAAAKSEVSIHAPTRGATLWRWYVLFMCSGFNPRTHTGCDADNPFKIFNRFQFQSTHPHGVRLALPIHKTCRGGFQSTHPHGVRHEKYWLALAAAMFQSTHPHGVRPCRFQN